MIRSVVSGLVLVALLLCAKIAAADNFETVFKQKYKEEMLPELRLSMTDRYKAKGMTDTAIEQALEKMAIIAADCKYKAYEAYDKKYREQVFKSILEGGSVEDADFELDDRLNAAVDKGEISRKDLNTQIKHAMNTYGECAVKSGLVDNKN